jgi:FlaA1/EpsC-like NDP-sugar epimerase
VDALTEALRRALTDAAWREEARAHGIARAAHVHLGINGPHGACVSPGACRCIDNNAETSSPLAHLTLIAGDVVLINLALYVSYIIRYDWQWFRSVDPANNNPFSVYIPVAVLLTALLLLIFRLDGVYDRRRSSSLLDTLYALTSSTTTGVVVMIVVALVYRPLLYSRLIFLYASVLIILFLSASRMLVAVVFSRIRARGVGMDRVLIVGAGEVGRTVMRTIVARPELGYRIVGFLDDNPEKGETDIGPFKALGGLDNCQVC